MGTEGAIQILPTVLGIQQWQESGGTICIMREALQFNILQYCKQGDYILIFEVKILENYHRMKDKPPHA